MINHKKSQYEVFFSLCFIVVFALLLLIMSCGDEETQLEPMDITGKQSGTLAAQKATPITTAPAAPQLPADGTPFVTVVSYYTDWKLTQPITDTVAPGTTLFTKIVFSEPMTFTAADDKTARPILYYQIDGERTRYRIAARGASGENFQSGDAKPKGSSTQTFVCKYTLPTETTGTFTTAVGRRNTDTDGNTLAAFYVHTPKLLIKHTMPQDAADIHLSKTNIDENNAPNTVIGTFGTQAGDRFSYRMIKGSRYYFEINENNALVAKRAFDHEQMASFEITIREKDRETRESLTQVFRIFVNDINEAPTGIHLSHTTVEIGMPPGTLIGTFQAIDEDVGDIHTFRVIAGDEFVSIEGNRLRKGADFPSDQGSVKIGVEVTDAGGASYSRDFTIQETSPSEETSEAPSELTLPSEPEPEETSKEPSEPAELFDGNPGRGDGGGHFEN